MNNNRAIEPGANTIDQQSSLSIDFAQKMFRIIQEPQFHDVIFLVGSGENQRRIGCNKALISVHCPVFEAMFKSSMLESSGIISSQKQSSRTQQNKYKITRNKKTKS